MGTKFLANQNFESRTLLHTKKNLAHGSRYFGDCSSLTRKWQRCVKSRQRYFKIDIQILVCAFILPAESCRETALDLIYESDDRQVKIFSMSWTEEQIEAVWKKASVVDGVNKDEWRTDCCDAWIARGQYGKAALYGWEIDHVFPESKGLELGYTQEQVDDIENLRPMQWENNRSKDDNYPSYSCAVVRSENKNIYKTEQKTVNENLKNKLDTRFKKK